MFKVKNIIILAAGRGSRMLDLCKNTPKPLLMFRGKPIIEALIEYFKSKNMNNIYVVTGYLANKMEYLASKYNVHIIENKDWENTNNISSIKCVYKYLEDSLIINGDVIINNDCISLEYEYSCTYAELNNNINEWAILQDKNNNIIDFNKNPKNWKGLYQREVTIISSELAKLVCNELRNFDSHEYYEFLVLYTAKKYNIDFKPYIIKTNLIYDIDNKDEFIIKNSK